MHLHLFGIALGLLASAWLPNWIGPPVLATMCGAMLGCAALCVCRARVRRPRSMRARVGRVGRVGIDGCLCVFALAAATLVGLHRTESQLAHRLPPAMHGQSATAEIEVQSLPTTSGPATRFNARVHSMGGDWDSRQPPPRRIRMTWFDAAEPVRAGDRWSLRVRLRSPTGNLNATGFDYEAWLLANQIDALASVQSGRLLSRKEGFSIQHTRAGLRSFFLQLKTPHRGSLLALASADTSQMQARDWRLFRDTGTTHLMVVSGLHLGLVALYTGLLGLGVLRCFTPLSRVLAAQTAGVACGVAAACAFSMLCGWTLPIQRAFIMVGCAALALLLRRRLRLVDAWLLALILVLIQSPYASLSSGFWLSFGAVALLMLLSWDVPAGRGIGYWTRSLLRTQVRLSLAMAPLLLIVVGELPLASPLANLVAIPVTTLIIVPGVLVASSLSGSMPWIAGGLLEAVGALFSAQVWVLEWLAHLPPLRVVSINPLVAAACLLSFLCVFVPGRAPLRWLMVLPGLLLVLIHVPSSERLPPGEFRLSVFDVGQGLSVFVETRGKTLLYDAGARYADGFDLGESVVAPSISALGRRRVDEFMISHWDNDHAGGAESVIDRLDVRSLVLAVDGKTSAAAR